MRWDAGEAVNYHIVSHAIKGATCELPNARVKIIVIQEEDALLLWVFFEGESERRRDVDCKACNAR